MAITRKSEAVDDYIQDCTENVIPLLEDLRAFIHAEMPEATEAMQYGVPVFLNVNGAPVIYLFGSKQHVNFGFLRSSELLDPLGMLKGSGKPSKHIKVFPEKPIDEGVLRPFIKQCEIMKG